MTKTCEAILYVKYNNVGGGIFKKKKKYFVALNFQQIFISKWKHALFFVFYFWGQFWVDYVLLQICSTECIKNSESKFENPLRCWRMEFCNESGEKIQN